MLLRVKREKPRSRHRRRRTRVPVTSVRLVLSQVAADIHASSARRKLCVAKATRSPIWSMSWAMDAVLKGFGLAWVGAGLVGCKALLAQLPMVTSVEAQNATGSPICMIVTRLESDPSIRHEEGSEHSAVEPLMARGATGRVYFALRRDQNGQASKQATDRYRVEVYGCELLGSSYRKGALVAEISDVDPERGTLLLR